MVNGRHYMALRMVLLALVAIRSRCAPSTGPADTVATPHTPSHRPAGNNYAFSVLRLHASEELHGSPMPDVSEVCKNHSLQYMQYVAELLLPPHTEPPSWSIQMMDATGKLPTGILEGNLRWLGSFSECLKIRVDDGQEGHFRGQYCTVQFQNKTTSTIPVNYIGEQIRGTPATLPPLIEIISLDICWPSTCNETELELILQYFGLGTALSAQPVVVESSCQVDHSKTFDASTIAVITLYCVFGATMLIGTVYEIICILWRQKKSSGEEDHAFHNSKNELGVGIISRIFLSFSVYRNGKKLLNTSRTKSAESLSCIHGIRFISMLWVILGHTYDFLISLPFKNPIVIKDVMKSWAFNVVLNGTFAVDTFLFLSGFLITYLGMKELKKTKGRLNILYFYLHRIWRLTPVLAMVIAFVAGPFYIMGSGPQWPLVQSAQTNCRGYWWRTVLYINNLYDTEHMCVEVSWYLAVDMQYYLIMPILLLALYHKPALGLSAIGVLFLMTILTPALYIHYHDIPGFSDLQVLFHPSAPASVDFSANVYIKPWCRMAPYLIGMLLAYYLYKKDMKIKMNWIVSVIGWLLAAALALILVYGTYHYYANDKHMSNALNSIYGALSKPAWGIAMGWVLLACVTGHGGYVNKLLSWRAFVPLGRLSYCSYLLHLYVMLFLYETQQFVYYYNDYLIVLLYLGILVTTLGVSFIFSMAFEAPMIELEKLLIPRPRGEPPELKALKTPDIKEIYYTQTQAPTPSISKKQPRHSNEDTRPETENADEGVDNVAFYNAGFDSNEDGHQHLTKTTA